MILVLLACIAGGYLLLVAVFALPISSMQQHVTDSLSTLQSEGDYPQLVQGYTGTQLDNYTDCLMLNQAIYDGEESNPFILALEGNGTVSADADASPVKNLQAALHQEGTTASEYTYPLYWYGTLVILKPLLCIMDYSSIRILNTIVQIVLIILFAKEMFDNHLQKYLVPFAVTWVFLTPLALFYSLQYSTMFYVAIITCIVYLILLKKGRINAIPYVFLIAGVATAYFDLLTYLLVSIGYPIILYIISGQPGNHKDGRAHCFLDILKFCIIWGLGYSIMWGSKWVISSLVLHENVIGAALDELLLRTSSTSQHGNSVSAVLAWKVNLYVYAHPIYLCLFLIPLAYYCYRGIAKHHKINVEKLVEFAFIAMIPFIWYALTKNHSYIHYFFAHRELTVTVLAVLCAGVHFSNGPTEMVRKA